MKLQYAAISLTGTNHEFNEDRALMGMRSLPPESGAVVCGKDRMSRVFAVFDGVGGHGGGAQAAEQALAGFSSACAQAHIQPGRTADDAADAEDAPPAEDPLVVWRAALATCLKEANDAILAGRAWGKRLGFCAAAGLALDEFGNVHVFHAGDVRVYRFRSPYAMRVTKDHSLAEQWRDEHPGQPTPSDIAHTITRSLGHPAPDAHTTDETWPFEMEQPTPAMPGDVYIACSDGIWEYTSEEDFERAFSDAESPADLADALSVIAAQARERGSYDDATIVAVRIA